MSERGQVSSFDRRAGSTSAGAGTPRTGVPPRCRSPSPTAVTVAVARVGCPHRHPALEVGDHLVGQLLLGRHLEVVVLVADRLDQQALLEVARHDRGAEVAPLADALPRVEHEVRLDLLGRRGVALVAVLDQHRADLRLEERELLRRDRPLGRAPLGHTLGLDWNGICRVNDSDPEPQPQGGTEQPPHRAGISHARCPCEDHRARDAVLLFVGQLEPRADLRTEPPVNSSRRRAGSKSRV